MQQTARKMHFVSSSTQKYLPAGSGLLPVSAQEVSCHFKNIDFSSHFKQSFYIHYLT